MSLARKSLANLCRFAPSPCRGGWGLVCILIIFICVHVCASPTSLNVIPTADVLPDRAANIAIQLNGGPTSSGYLFVNQLQTQLGVGDNAEFGYDASLGPEGEGFWNAKYRICTETRRRPALAVGVLSNVGRFDNPLYVTSYKTYGQARLHVGAVQVSGSLRAMLGWELQRRLGPSG